MCRNLCLCQEKWGGCIMKGLPFFVFFFCLSQHLLCTAMLEIHAVHQEAGLKRSQLQDESPKEPHWRHPIASKA